MTCSASHQMCRARARPARRAGPGGAVSVLPCEELVEVGARDEHQDHADHHADAAEPDRQRDARRRSCLRRSRRGRSSDRVDADAVEHQPADAAARAREQELAHAREQLAPVVPGARQAGRAVVEADREAERDDGEFEHAFGDQEQRRPRRRSRAAPKPMSTRSGVRIAFVDFSEHPGDRLSSAPSRASCARSAGSSSASRPRRRSARR